MVEVLTWQELVRHAGTPAKARTLLARDDWRRVLRGAYVQHEEPDDLDVRVAAARRVLPAHAALSHRSGLWVLGDDVLLHGVLDVTAPRGLHLERRPGLRLHTAALPDTELVLIDGLLVVSAARAVVDVAREERLDHAVAFGDRALRLGATTPDRIEVVLDAAAGLRGVRGARRAVGLLNGRSESWQESRLRVTLHLGGLDGLEVQADLYDRDGHVARSDLRLDGAWLEYDGRKERLEGKVFVAERRRQSAVSDRGYEVRRFTSPDLDRLPVSLVAEVRRAVALGADRDRSGVCSGPDTLPPPRLTPLPTLAELSAAVPSVAA